MLKIRGISIVENFLTGKNRLGHAPAGVEPQRSRPPRVNCQVLAHNRSRYPSKRRADLSGANVQQAGLLVNGKRKWLYVARAAAVPKDQHLILRIEGFNYDTVAGQHNAFPVSRRKKSAPRQ